MAINNNFYITVNSLVQAASKGQAKTITDYTSFVDFGKSLSDLSGSDFANGYMSAIANKVQLVIDTGRGYKGKIKSVIRGNTTPEAVIELLTHGFFEMRSADFINVPDGNNATPFVTNKGTVTAKYYIDDIAFQLPVSKNMTQIISAFKTPEAMDSFLNQVLLYAANSIELAKEQTRRGLLGAQIARLENETAAANMDTPAQRVKLVELYNDLYDESLDASDCLANASFVKFAIMVIKKYKAYMENPNELMNKSGIKTFTPAEAQKLITLDALDAAVVAFKTTFQGEATDLGTHESIAFWQNNNNPYVVYSGAVNYVATDDDRKHANVGDISYVIASGKTYKCTATASTGTFEEITDFEASTYASVPVIGILFDEFALGNYVTHDSVYTAFNARTETTTIWHNVAMKNCILDDANCVIFTLE